MEWMMECEERVIWRVTKREEGRAIVSERNLARGMKRSTGVFMFHSSTDGEACGRSVGFSVIAVAARRPQYWMMILRGEIRAHTREGSC